MRTLALTLSVALISGAAYGQDFYRAAREEQARFERQCEESRELAQRQQAEAQAQLQAQIQQEQLRELQEAQRQMQYDLQQLSQPQ
jgi:hypothetical protein